MDAAYKFSRESIDFLVNPFIGVSRFRVNDRVRVSSFVVFRVLLKACGDSCRVSYFGERSCYIFP